MIRVLFSTRLRVVGGGCFVRTACTQHIIIPYLINVAHFSPRQNASNAHTHTHRKVVHIICQASGAFVRSCMIPHFHVCVGRVCLRACKREKLRAPESWTNNKRQNAKHRKTTPWSGFMMQPPQQQRSDSRDIIQCSGIREKYPKHTRRVCVIWRICSGKGGPNPPPPTFHSRLPTLFPAVYVYRCCTGE